MKSNSKNPKVILVGAGPGDEELITVKGLNAIKNADVVLYDALVNKELLKFVKPNVECVYVGKRFNKHKYTQDAINQMVTMPGQSQDTLVTIVGIVQNTFCIR